MNVSSIAVLGAGAWGTALANVAARRGGEVVLWARDAAHAAEIAATGVNARRLPGIALAGGIAATADLAQIAGAGIVIAAVPAQMLRALLSLATPHLASDAAIVLSEKGIERGSGAFMSEVAAAAAPGHPHALLSGPSFAADVAQGLPTAVTLACTDASLAATLAEMLTTPSFRVYHTDDIRGVEIGGAAKNVLAIASGIAAGRGLGASAGAALIARGFAELARFGEALGARPTTLMGLSGLGDLVLTCSSPQSRNFALGGALGRGSSLADATAGGALAEGAHTAAVLVDLARRHAIDLPIAMAVAAVLDGSLNVDDAIATLLARPVKPETGKTD